MSSAATGVFGEEYTTQYLSAKGFKIIARNYRCRYGEIDIIAENEQYLVFVEVKTRGIKRMYEPIEAVSYSKVQKIIKTASIYLMENQTQLQPRFDVAEIIMGTNNTKDIKRVHKFHYIENAFC